MNDSLLSAYYIFPALLLPFAGALIGKLLIRGSNSRGAIRGFATGLFGPFAVILFLLYSWLSETIGLSSLLNILACLAAAVLLGAVWGKVIRACLSSNPQEDE